MSLGGASIAHVSRNAARNRGGQRPGGAAVDWGAAPSPYGRPRRRLSADGRLAHFAGVADTHGFTDGVLGLFADLQRQAVPAAGFTEATRTAGAKERQCAHLYAQYQSELRRQNLHDARRRRRPRRRNFASRDCENRSPKCERCSWTASAISRGRSTTFCELLSEWVEEIWITLPGEEGGQR